MTSIIFSIRRFSLWLIAFLAPLLFVQTSCKDEPIPPVIEQPQDTTSHNFVVTRVDTLGTTFSFANGVDIVDENDIWVAGIFTERDTDGTILYKKNLAHWDGEKWTLMSIPMYGYNNTGPSPEELGAVKVFSDSNIFVVAKHDNSVAWWNGTKWISSYINNATVSPIFWARSPDDIYFVAREGRATHWDGQTFTKINTGLTNPPLTDVWGDENEVYAVGTGHDSNEGTEAAFLSGNKLSWSVNSKYDWIATDPNGSSNVGIMHSLYRFSKHSKLWLLGGDLVWQIFQVESISPFRAKKFFDLPGAFPADMIRGTADNDIYITSQLHGEFYHYNGITWKRYTPLIPELIVFNFAVKNKTWVTTGALANSPVGSAVVIVGRHE